MNIEQHGPSVIPKPSDPDYKIPPHREGLVYYTAVQVGEGGDILTCDANGVEFPAPRGYYFQQWDPKKDMGIDGYFGPYDSYEDMPEHVRKNFADDFLQDNFHNSDF